jgi:glycosyltransferase involved in cell wall biosynthesis
LTRELRAAGDRVEVFPPRRAPTRGLDEAFARALRRARTGACLIHHFSRRVPWLERAVFPDDLALVLVHQGASAGLLDAPRSFARLARRADAVAAVSRSGARELRAFLPAGKRAAVCPNGADAAPRRRRRKTGRPFILTIGRLAAYKGTDLLLLAFSGVAADFPVLDLIVCGPDQSDGRLARFAARLGLGARVRFTGPVTPARARRLLDACLFFCLPSRAEGMPMALLEAMAAGKAAVAARAGGCPEAARSGREALLVAPGDARSLERALRRLAGDAGLRARLGAAAAARARDYSWRRAAALSRRLLAAAVRRRSALAPSAIIRP